MAVVGVPPGGCGAHEPGDLRLRDVSGVGLFIQPVAVDGVELMQLGHPGGCVVGSVDFEQV